MKNKELQKLIEQVREMNNRAALRNDQLKEMNQKVQEICEIQDRINEQNDRNNESLLRQNRTLAEQEARESFANDISRGYTPIEIWEDIQDLAMELGDSEQEATDLANGFFRAAGQEIPEREKVEFETDKMLREVLGE